MNAKHLCKPFPNETPRDHHARIEFFAEKFERVSYDMELYTFKGGSQLLVQLDENLRPAAVVEI